MQPKLSKGKLYTKVFPFLMLTPVIIFFCLFTFYPFIKSIYLTFFVTDSIGNPGAFVGVKNYIRIFTSDGFWNSFTATMKFAALVAVGTFTLAMTLSLLCIQNIKGSKVYQTMYALPMALASVPVSALAIYFLSRYGVLNAALGLEINWLADYKTALIAAAGVTVWSYVGSSFLYLLVGFRNVSDDLVEAATLDGASMFTKITKIYIPMASPQIFFVMFLNILNSFKAFGYIKLLVGTGPKDSTNVLVYAMYANAFLRNRFETACVYALVLCLVIFVVTRIQLMCEKRMVHYQ